MITLDQWQLKDFAPGEGQANGDDGWIAVRAPGDTYLALHAAGRIPHPFADDNEKTSAWVEGREWWWRTTFQAPRTAADGARLRLIFEGLDTFAAIWLNGERIGTTDNMFRAFDFDVTSLLAAGTNHLAVAFTPPSAITKDMALKAFPASGAQIADSKRNMIRKAQFGWGWDWGPCLPTVGIWQPVRLVRETAAALTDVQVTTLDRDGRVRITLEIDAFAARKPLLADIAVADPSGQVVVRRVLGQANTIDVQIPDPQLWWTRELGGQPLYTLTVKLLHGGREIDTRAVAFGIRTIALDRGPDHEEPGTDFFRFVLNGVPVFAKGVNWIPASSFVAALTKDDYARLLDAAVDANMNMVRVWGGGIYEPDVFHDLCDERGLLVWQDFMFACARYPEGDPAFVENVRAEAAYQVKRLRNHPSTALWCGNNEGQIIQELVNWMTNTAEPYEGGMLFDTVLAQIAGNLDPTTPYWPGSPYGGPMANSMKAGDVHDWTVWHGIPPIPDDKIEGTVDRSPEGVAYTRYAEDMGRFISEYGIQASPARATLARWMADPDGLALNGEAFLNRVKDNPKNKVDGMLIPVTGLPETMDQYVDFTQLTQGEGLKFAIEHFRRRKPHCSGSLIWQHNDCWPGISWSIVDYDGVAKAGFYFVKRAYAPIVGTFKALADGGVEFWIVNDTLKTLDVSCWLALSSLWDGAEHWSEEIDVRIGANQSVRVWQANAKRLGAGTGRVLTARSPQFPPNRHFFAPIKDLPLSDAMPEMRIDTIDAHTLRVILTGTAYHYGIRLDAPHAATRYSDNCFDLTMGEIRTITVGNPQAAIAPEDLTVRTLLRHV
ncbi:MAG TPA: glycoside hydrolase family 2 protein [Rhizomicrobium sp.]|jgi:beta-mannosidase|nr:glycoside hydrolase family 2 protein [Rhizomicrobium sp.]